MGLKKSRNKEGLKTQKAILLQTSRVKERLETTLLLLPEGGMGEVPHLKMKYIGISLCMDGLTMSAMVE